MRNRRDYADVSSLEGKPSNVGFLGTPYPFGFSPSNLFSVTTILAAAFAIYIGMT